MKDIEKVREALSKMFSLYDKGFGEKPKTVLRLSLSFEEVEECKQILGQALTKLERLQKVEINNHLFTIAVGYNLALVNNKDITEKQFYEIINKHYEIAIARSDEK